MLSLAAAKEGTRTVMQTLLADIKVGLWVVFFFFPLIEKNVACDS